MAQFVGATTALSLSLGMAQAAQSNHKPTEHVTTIGSGTTGAGAGKLNERKAGGNDMGSGGGAGKVDDRKSGGQNIGSATTGAGAGKAQTDVSSYQSGGHGH